MEEDNIVLAKDIEDCDSCPLKDHDCPGGWTSGGSGQPIELLVVVGMTIQRSMLECMTVNTYIPSKS